MMLPTGRDSSSNPVKRSRWLNIYLQMSTGGNFHHDYGYANEFRAAARYLDGILRGLGFAYVSMGRR